MRRQRPESGDGKDVANDGDEGRRREGLSGWEPSDCNVAYDLTCDTCEFDRTVDAENDAYADAKAHESDHPDHFVLIYTAE